MDYFGFQQTSPLATWEKKRIQGLLEGWRVAEEGFETHFLRVCLGRAISLTPREAMWVDYARRHVQNPDVDPVALAFGQALLDGDLHAATPLLASIQDPDTIVGRGATLLMVAAYREHYDICAALLQLGADPQLSISRLDHLVYRESLQWKFFLREREDWEERLNFDFNGNDIVDGDDREDWEGYSELAPDNGDNSYRYQAAGPLRLYSYWRDDNGSEDYYWTPNTETALTNARLVKNDAIIGLIQRASARASWAWTLRNISPDRLPIYATESIQEATQLGMTDLEAEIRASGIQFTEPEPRSGDEDEAKDEDVPAF